MSPRLRTGGDMPRAKRFGAAGTAQRPVPPNRPASVGQMRRNIQAAGAYTCVHSLCFAGSLLRAHRCVQQCHTIRTVATHRPRMRALQILRRKRRGERMAANVKKRREAWQQNQRDAVLAKADAALVCDLPAAQCGWSLTPPTC